MLRADGLAPAPFALRREEAATCARPPSPRLWVRVGGEITHEPHMDRNTKTSLTKLRKVSSPISLRSPSKAHLPALGGGSLVRCTARPSAWPPSAVSGPAAAPLPSGLSTPTFVWRSPVRHTRSLRFAPGTSRAGPHQSVDSTPPATSLSARTEEKHSPLASGHLAAWRSRP